MARRTPLHARASSRDAHLAGGVEGNARLTNSVAAVLFVLLFIEGVTILQIGGLIGTHVFVGVVLIPPLLVKIGTTTWRFARYYRAEPAYVRKGPPAPLLRLLGPLVIVLSIAVVASGVLLVVGAPLSLRGPLLQIHQATFLLWFAVTALHVLGHMKETLAVAPRDWVRATRHEVHGASWRQWTLVASLALGLVWAWWITPYAAGWRTLIGH